MPAMPEERSLALGLWVSLAIALGGLLAYGLSGSEAVLLDGLYAGVMALTSLVAARVGSGFSSPNSKRIMKSTQRLGSAQMASTRGLAVPWSSP